LGPQADKAFRHRMPGLIGRVESHAGYHIGDLFQTDIVVHIGQGLVLYGPDLYDAVGQRIFATCLTLGDIREKVRSSVSSALMTQALTVISGFGVTQTCTSGSGT
jgi:hypothetical protein